MKVENDYHKPNEYHVMTPFSILVIDSDEEFRTFLVTALQDEGFAVAATETAAEALTRMHKENPRMVIADWKLPDMTGADLCQVIKEDPVLREIIIVILSNSTDLDTKLTCFDNGANEFITKPFEIRELIARIKRFIRMIEEIKTSSPAVQPTHLEMHPAPATSEIASKDRSHGTVDFLGLAAPSDSFTRIKPKYGIYRVETLIGSGAMGHVFKAYDEPLERFVAVKILTKKLSSSPEFVQRFHREAKVLASIDHPGIAFIYSFGEEEGEHYFAMQWCPGGSLSDFIRKKQRIEVLPAVDIVLQCAHGLAAAAKKGIVHRDIKPSNILFDEYQQVKVVDFGLASAEKMSARVTQAQEFLGTPSFMAPEQAQSSSVDHRADIYSLGITFYCMLYGKLPFEANSAIEMVIKQATQPLPSFADLGGKVPRRAYEIIEKMTQKGPDARYQDYSRLIQDLERLRNVLLSQAQWKIPRPENMSPVPSLKNSNILELLATLQNQNVSGVLRVHWSGLEKKFLIRQRELVLFESTQQNENIWVSLAQKNLLKKEEVPPKTEDLETSLNRFLLNQTLTMEDFRSSYRDLMKTALMQVFFWPVLEGEFFSASIEHDAFATLRIGDALLEAARSYIDYDQLKTDVPHDRHFIRAPQFEQMLSTLNITPEESFLASRFEGAGTTLNTLQLLTGLPEENITRFVYALEKLGALQFKTAEDVRSQRKAEMLRPTSTTPISMFPVKESFKSSSPGKTVLTRSPRIEVEVNLNAKPMKATPIGTESNPKKDSGEPFVRMEVQKSEKKIEVEHHSRVAEQFFRLAQEKFLEMDYWKVTQLCKQAIKNNPGESKYYHLMAMAYAQHPRFGKDAEQCFYKALEIDPWNAEYHIDLAKFYLTQGLHVRALNQCQKAIDLSPQNHRAKELQAEINAKYR